MPNHTEVNKKLEQQYKENVGDFISLLLNIYERLDSKQHEYENCFENLIQQISVPSILEHKAEEYLILLKYINYASKNLTNIFLKHCSQIQLLKSDKLFQATSAIISAKEIQQNPNYKEQAYQNINNNIKQLSTIEKNCKKETKENFYMAIVKINKFINKNKLDITLEVPKGFIDIPMTKPKVKITPIYKQDCHNQKYTNIEIDSERSWNRQSAMHI